MVYNRRSRHYGGDAPADAWAGVVESAEARARVQRMLHRPHRRIKALRSPGPATGAPVEGYRAAPSVLISYEVCGICLAVWPCSLAGRCVSCHEEFPCTTIRDLDGVTS